LTVSEFSRQRIIDWSGVDPSRVVNVGNGVDSAYSPNAVRYEPGYAYLLVVSNRKAHKNDVGVLNAFAIANLSASVHLIFTGAVTDELQRIARENAVEQRVHFLGRLPDADLPSIYAGALALVFPSFYEGFGLPVIEAMACGTPVITSNSTSLPEVAGDAALLVNPTSVSEISAAIKRVVADPDLRASLRRKGIERARHFNWDAVAQRVYCAICGGADKTIVEARDNDGQKK
jgi:glycosyltransferase involved in cell wall biosynthesis